MQYQFVIDPSSLFVESELVALRHRLESVEELVGDDHFYLGVPEQVADLILESDRPIEDSPIARFYVDPDDRAATRKQIEDVLESFPWDTVSDETEDRPFDDAGYHDRVAAVLDTLLARLQDETNHGWLVAAKRNTLDAFARAKQTIVQIGTETAENIVETTLDLDEDAEAVLTVGNVAKTLGKFAVIGGAAAGTTVVGAAAFPTASAVAVTGGAAVLSRVVLSIDP